MTTEKLERVQYWTVQYKLAMKNITGQEFEHDFDHYHDARAMLHEKAEHDWGVATGLEVRQTGVQQLRVSPGVAIDRAGRLIALSDADAGPRRRVARSTRAPTITQNWGSSPTSPSGTR